MGDQVHRPSDERHESQESAADKPRPPCPSAAPQSNALDRQACRKGVSEKNGDHASKKGNDGKVKRKMRRDYEYGEASSDLDRVTTPSSNGLGNSLALVQSSLSNPRCDNDCRTNE